MNPDPVGLFPESGIICLESDPGKNEQTSKCYFIFALIMQKKYSGMLIERDSGWLILLFE